MEKIYSNCQSKITAMKDNRTQLNFDLILQFTAYIPIITISDENISYDVISQETTLNIPENNQKMVGNFIKILSESKQEIINITEKIDNEVSGCNKIPFIGIIFLYFVLILELILVLTKENIN